MSPVGAAELEAQTIQQVRTLNDAAFIFLEGAGGDRVQAAKLLDDFIDLFFEGGALQVWRHRMVLEAIAEGL